MNIQEATAIELTDAERAVLESLVRSAKTERRLVERAWVVLLAARGLATRAIHRELGCTIGTASKWRVRFGADRLAGLQDKPRSGPKAIYDETTGRRILAKLDEPPPAGYGRWTAPLLSAALGDVSDQYIWRFLRAQRIDLTNDEVVVPQHRPGLSGILCVRRFSSLTDEPITEHNGELGLGLAPFAGWPLPLFGSLVQNEI